MIVVSGLWFSIRIMHLRSGTQGKNLRLGTGVFTHCSVPLSDKLGDLVTCLLMCPRHDSSRDDRTLGSQLLDVAMAWSYRRN